MINKEMGDPKNAFRIRKDVIQMIQIIAAGYGQEILACRPVYCHGDPPRWQSIKGHLAIKMPLIRSVNDKRHGISRQLVLSGGPISPPSGKIIRNRGWFTRNRT
jgi:hypothetical protein